MPCPSIGPNCFELVQIISRTGLNISNQSILDLSKMIWTSLRENVPVQNYLDGPK